MRRPITTPRPASPIAHPVSGPVTTARCVPVCSAPRARCAAPTGPRPKAGPSAAGPSAAGPSVAGDHAVCDASPPDTAGSSLGAVAADIIATLAGGGERRTGWRWVFGVKPPAVAGGLYGVLVAGHRV